MNIIQNKFNDLGSYSLPQLPRTSKGDDVASGSVSTVVESKPEKVVFEQSNNEAKRLENLKVAAQSMANYFAVSDVSISIFKDATGQFITRFTSLKDGSVSYYPEPVVVKSYSDRQGGTLPIFSAEV